MRVARILAWSDENLGDAAFECPDYLEMVAWRDACLNDADQQIAAEIDLTAEATTCALGCLSDTDPIGCSDTCLKENTGISDACGGCYTATVKCTFDNCLAQCAADPSSDACGTCQEENNCITDFYTCSGLTASEDSE